MAGSLGHHRHGVQVGLLGLGLMPHHNRTLEVLYGRHGIQAVLMCGVHHGRCWYIMVVIRLPIKRLRIVIVFHFIFLDGFFPSVLLLLLLSWLLFACGHFEVSGVTEFVDG